MSDHICPEPPRAGPTSDKVELRDGLDRRPTSADGAENSLPGKVEGARTRSTAWLAMALAIPLGVGGAILAAYGMNFRHAVLSVGFIAAGLFLGIGTALDLPVIVDHAKAQVLAERIGRGGMRAVYMLLGFALTAVGAWVIWQAFVDR